MEKKMKTKKYYTKPLIEIIHCRPIQALCTSDTTTWSLGGENGGYPPTKNGDIRSLLCA